MKNDQAAHRVLLYWASYLQKYACDMDSTQESRPLESIFARMSLSEDRSNKPMSACYLLPRLLSEDISYPSDQFEQSEKVFTEWKCSVCKKTPEELKEMSVSDILFWLEVHGAYVHGAYAPAGDDTTVSLFDRAKTEAAIATCLEHPDICSDEPFLLVAGDFSGMQDFIYTISSQGALKTLRARSFFLEMLAQHVIYEILNIESLRLNRTNLIYSGGGMFYLLLPNNESAESSLRKVKTEINDWLFDEHSARLYLGLKWVPTTKDVIESDATTTWSNVIELLENDKRQKFLDKIKSGEMFQIEAPEQETNEASCQICHRDDVEETEQFKEELRACKSCLRLYKLGDKLPDTVYIVRGEKESEGNLQIQVGEHWYTVFEQESKIQQLQEGSDVWQINPFEKSENGKPEKRKDAIPLYIGNYVRQHGELPERAKEKECQRRVMDGEKTPGDSDMASFEGLAKAACGADLVGILRMDVDNLGKLMADALPQNHRTIAHLSYLSRSLTQFFTLHLNEICKGNTLLPDTPLDIAGKNPKDNNGRDVTTVYAGGDDLFVVGAWSDVAELAFDVQKCFDAYTCKNPDISISGGMITQQPKFPIYQMARIAGEAEHSAKRNRAECRKEECRKDSSKCSLYASGECGRKSSIALLYDVAIASEAAEMKEKFKNAERIKVALTWDKADEYVLELVKLLKETGENKGTHINPDALPRGFIYKVFEVINIWRGQGVLYLPTFAWILRHTQNALKRRKGSDFANKFVSKFYTFNPEQIAAMHIPMSWFDLLTRGGKENESTL